MAQVRALAAACEAVRHVLESAAAADSLGFDASFQVFGSSDFSAGTITTGVSVFLYRVLPNLAHRTPAGRLQPNGQRQRTQLPLDLHLLLTAWGEMPDTVNTLVGWMLRTLEDYPTLPASVLNISHPGTFSPDESVELVVGEMAGEELLHLWEVLGQQTTYHISVPYVARALFIESQRQVTTAGPVQARLLDMGVLAERGVA